MTRRWPGHRRGRRAGTAALVLAALGPLLAGAAGTAAPAAAAGDVTARLGPLTVRATALHPRSSGALTASLRLSTSARRSGQLDAAIAAGGEAVALYHEQVSLAEIPDLTGCGSDVAPLRLVEHWLHYGPLQIPGQSAGTAAQADATLTVQPGTTVAGGTVTVTLYFAGGGVLPLTLPVDR